MVPVKDSFLDLERHVKQLEANVDKLRKTLEHWRTWDAEYEALKEEVKPVAESSLGAAKEAAELARIRSGFEGELVSAKELDDIFGTAGSAGVARTAEQVVGVLDRRLDYVGKNLGTLARQIVEAEKKRDAANVVSNPGATDEEGLPITEIFEQLDEEGNVVSHELWRPGDKGPQVQELLQKAGLLNASGSQQAPAVLAEAEQADKSLETAVPEPQPPASANSQKPLVADDSQPTPKATPNATSSVDRKDKDNRPVPERKTLSQVEDDQLPEQPQMSKAAKRVQKIMEAAKQQEEISKESPVIPEGESPEDAALRRQMLDYSMNGNYGMPNGMGEVVAIMSDLRFEESGDDDSFNTYSDDDEEDSDGEDDDEEDKYGRSTKRVVSSKYQERMLDLERRLGVQSRFTRQLAEDIKIDVEEEDNPSERIGKILVKRTETEPARDAPAASVTTTTAAAVIRAPDASPIVGKHANGGVLKAHGAHSEKKSVRFAGALDIAPDETAQAKDLSVEPKVENPVSDLIVEQTDPSPQISSTAAASGEPSRKASRFKQLRKAATETAPVVAPSQGKDTITEPVVWTETIVERDVTSVPVDMDDHDDEISRRAVADEYHRMRRRMIEREGGFLKEDRNPIQPLDEEEGGPRRVSLFKAARLSRQ